jgi:membrane-bound transcription factor site-1 protease
MKQALVHTAVRLPHDERSVFEQGQGMLNLSAAAIYLDTYTPRVTILPPKLDTTDCPYMWPYCRQPLYYSAQPLLANFTILNGLGAVGYVTGPVTWHPASADADLIDVAAEPSALLWPWAGSLGVRIAVRREARYASAVAAGELRLTVISPPSVQEMNQGPQPAAPRRAQVALPIRVHIEPTPPRARRLLWDQFHSLAYPPGYLPRDDLGQRADPLDWNGDHPHTNFRSVFHHLRNAGYFVEILSEPWTCFDPHLYGALLLVDPEEEIFAREATHLRRAVAETGLNLLIVADWYSEAVLDGVRFFDDNTRNWWFPETGGANVPALNGLLAPWGMAFGGDVLDGKFTFQDSVVPFHSGTSLAAFPVGGYLVSAMLNNQALQMETSSKHKDGGPAAAAAGASGPRTLRAPIIGLYAVPPEPEDGKPHEEADSPRSRGPGRVVLYGDSSCLDDSHATDTQRCLGLLDAFLGYLEGQDEDLPASALLDVAQRLSYPLPIPAEGLPDRSPKSTLHLYSRVLESTGRSGAERELPLCRSTVWAPQRGPGLAASQPVVVTQTAGEGVQNLKKKLAPPPPGQARTVAPNRFVPRSEKGRSFSGVLFAKLMTPGGMIFLLGFSIVVFSQMRGRRGRSRTRVMQFAGSASGGRGGRGEQGQPAGHSPKGAMEDVAARV